MIWAPGSIWKVFQLVRAIFEQFGAGPVTWSGLTAPQAIRCVVGSLTALGKVSRFLLFVAFPCCIVALVRGGVCFGIGRACICAGGALCGVRALVWWFALFA
jgi:hypothetical protein